MIRRPRFVRALFVEIPADDAPGDFAEDDADSEVLPVSKPFADVLLAGAVVLVLLPRSARLLFGSSFFGSGIECGIATDVPATPFQPVPMADAIHGLSVIDSDQKMRRIDPGEQLQQNFRVRRSGNQPKQNHSPAIHAGEWGQLHQRYQQK